MDVFMDKWLNFNGRIRRMGWWIAGIAVSIVSSIVRNILEGDDPNFLVATVIAAFAILFWLVGLSLSVRRWHDLNKSGWWLLVNLIPVIGWIYSLIMLGFMPGDRGHNNYGPPPKEGDIL